MKKVLVVPGDHKACGYYRMIQPATVLNIMSNQIKCIISPGEIIMVNDMDILYIQRCCSPTLLETLSKVKNTCPKLKIFIDFDDLIFTSNVGSIPDYNLCRTSRTMMESSRSAFLMTSIETPSDSIRQGISVFPEGRQFSARKGIRFRQAASR